MAVGQSERVNMLSRSKFGTQTSYQDLSSRPKEQSKYVLECERFLHYGRNDGGRVRQMLLMIFCVLFSVPDLLGTSALAQSQHRDKAILVSPVYGQEANGLLMIKPLQIGDTIPEELWNMPLQVVNHPDGKDSICLADYSDKKLIILDFWATWCAACIKMFPKMDSLEKAFHDDLFVLGVTTEPKSKVQPFFDKRREVAGAPLKLVSLVQDQIFNALFPTGALPHYVWLDGTGRVLAITEWKDINRQNVEKAISGKKLDLKVKSSMFIDIDKKKPFIFSDESLRDAKIIVQRSLTGFMEGISGGFVNTTLLPDDHPFVNGHTYRRISVRNQTIAQLFQVAFSGSGKNFHWPNTELRVKEKDAIQVSVSGEDYLAWKRTGKAFCYEIIVDKSMAHDAHELMKRDLEVYFPQYKARVERQKIPAICLIRTSNIDKLKSKSERVTFDLGPFGGKTTANYLNTFVQQLYVYGLRKDKKPIVNLTNYNGLVDLEFEADMSSIESLNKALKAYDLQLVEQDHEIEVLVIEDVVPGEQGKEKNDE